MKKDKFEAALGIQPSQEIEIVATPNLPDKNPNQADIDQDYEFSREVLHDLIRQGSSALSEITELAKESESPRAFEVLSNMIKTISDTTNALVDLHKKRRDLIGVTKDNKPIDETTVNVEKAVFVGTTAELLKEMKKLNNG